MLLTCLTELDETKMSQEELAEQLLRETKEIYGRTHPSSGATPDGVVEVYSFDCEGQPFKATGA